MQNRHWSGSDLDNIRLGSKRNLSCNDFVDSRTICDLTYAISCAPGVSSVRCIFTGR